MCSNKTNNRKNKKLNLKDLKIKKVKIDFFYNFIDYSK